jgi:hypothetical protein
VTHLILHSVCSDPITIDYNTKHQFGEFTVWYEPSLLSLDNKTMQTGFYIKKKVDGRWMLDNGERDYFLASLGHSSNDVLVGIPACEYDDIYNIEGFTQVSTAVLHEMDEYRNLHVPNIAKFQKVPMMWYRLIFPPMPGMTDIRLSVREIYQSDSLTDDTSLELDYYPSNTKHKVTGKTINWWAAWKVVCHDVGGKDGDRKRGKPELEPKKSKAAQAAELYAEALYGRGGAGRGNGRNRRRARSRGTEDVEGENADEVPNDDGMEEDISFSSDEE